MANGFYGTDEEWQRIESTLQSTDVVFRACAAQHNLQLSVNANSDSRKLGWLRLFHSLGLRSRKAAGHQNC